MKASAGETLTANGPLVDGTGAVPVAASALVIEDGREYDWSVD